jgi:starch phosphorylase
MEFLMGRLISTSLLNLGLYDECKEICKELGFELSEILEEEHDMGLGNGGLGRLASCFMDSLASMELPATGYGIRYQYGIFEQKISENRQIERPDNWLKFGTPWELMRADRSFIIRIAGKVQTRTDEDGNEHFEWVDTRKVLAVAHDINIPGYKNNYVNTLRLWQARPQKDFDFHKFNQGDYIESVEDKNIAENITKVLYPNDNTVVGKELRLKQQYFFVSASIQDIIRKHKIRGNSMHNFHEKNVLQLNDTHPAIAIAELMHILLDQEMMDWEEAWAVTEKTFAYTNHTVLNEALEKWSVELFRKLLPRHLQIIFEINSRFLNRVRTHFRNNLNIIRELSLIEEGDDQKIRMANLASIGSFSINGVAGLHTEILKARLFHNFHELFPEKLTNKTNGVTHRRWLLHANPKLSQLITETIGDDWIHDLSHLSKLAAYAEDDNFQKKWDNVKLENKQHLIEYVRDNYHIDLNPKSIFDVQIKRIHEYKRQLLNILHVITLYNRIKDNPNADYVPRTVLFGGKAAPGYLRAKQIIHLINEVATIVNNDNEIGDKLKVLFLENYSVSLAEKIIPAANLSEQISTAGFEASGTGNMKFMMNGALTIGTEDGANIEIIEEVGKENAFIFGMNATEVNDLKSNNYIPDEVINSDYELSRIFKMIEDNFFSPIEFGIFNDILHNLRYNDFYCLVQDYQEYITAQLQVEKEYANKKLWIKKSILNTAYSGRFSSDRTIAEYNKDIWKLG